MFQGIKNTYKKSEAAVIVQNLLQLRIDEGSFYDDAGKSANFLIKSIWEKSPEYYNGRRGQRPHKLSLAASALANAISVIPDFNRNVMAFMVCLGTVLEEITNNWALYPFNSLDQQLFENAKKTFEQAEKEFIASPAGREMTNILSSEKNKNNSPINGDIIGAPIIRVQTSDWLLSEDQTVLDKKIVTTTNYGTKCWVLSFNKSNRVNGEKALYFALATEIPTGGDDIGNVYSAFIHDEEKALCSVTLRLMSQDTENLYMTEDSGDFRSLSSYCLSGLEGTFSIMGYDSKVLASFPWPFDESFHELLPIFLGELKD